jgi:lysophospholipase L1-like esterase
MKNNHRTILQNLSLLIFSTVLALLLGEIALRIMGRTPHFVSAEQRRFWHYHPQLGWAHQPGQEGVFEAPQFRIQVRINQKGLRDREHSYEHPQAMKRILVLGNSFAWGYGVEESDRFSERLETLMGVEVINAAVSGYSTDQALLWFGSEGIKYQTDLVILTFCGNDIGDNKRQNVHTIYNKPLFLIEEGNMTLEGVPVPKADLHIMFAHRLRQHTALFNLLISAYKNIEAKILPNNPPVTKISTPRKPFEITRSLIKEIKNIAQLNGAQFMIVATDAYWYGPSEGKYSDFIDALRADGFLVLDVAAMKEFDQSDMLIVGDEHWNSVGHEFVANEIQDYINENQLLTP